MADYKQTFDHAYKNNFYIIAEDENQNLFIFKLDIGPQNTTYI